METTQSDIDRVLTLERELQTPGVRSDPRRLAELLAPTFVEVGASGRRWDLEAILGLLAAESDDPGREPIVMSHLEARALTSDVIQVWWDSDRGGRRARRTSLWLRTGDDWQQVYHQGTLLPRASSSAG